MYVLVRRDQSFGQIVVQAGHAAIEACRRFLLPDADHPHLIVCGVRNQAELLKEKGRLESLGIRLQTFYEPDIGDEATALATEPVCGDRRQYFRRYQLVRPPSQKKE